MLSKKISIQRAISALCLVTLCSCAQQTCRQWILLENRTCDPSYTSGRMVLERDTHSCRMELEIDRSRSGLRMYINLALFQAAPLPDNPCVSKAELVFCNESLIFYPYLLEGGQRLLIPSDVTERIIELLSDDCSLILRLGRQEMTIIPDSFQLAYNKLMELEIQNTENP